MRSLLLVVILSALWTTLVAGSDGGRHFKRASNGTAASAALITSTGTAPEITATRLRRNDTTVSPGCGDVWMSWYNSSISFDVFFTTFTTTFTYHNITASTTTLCDGHPRVIGGEDGLTTVATGTSSSETATPYTYPSPKPTCRIPFSECTDFVANMGFCTNGPTTSVSSRDCGPCSIWGGTVDLYYFPVTASATRDLCAKNGTGATTCPLAPTGTPYSVKNPYMQTPCDYLTDHITSTTDSGPYIVSDGNTFYENRVYLSLDTIYAENSCGYVGSQYTGRTITLASSAVHSVFGYHHEFYDIGYQFDFRDLSPLQLPADVFYSNCNGGQDPSCHYDGDRYIFGRDFINGRRDLDLGSGGAMRDDPDKYNSKYELIWEAAHSPQILVPLEVRTLDPAWSTCFLNLGGLYDPPKALKGAATQAMPTAPSDPQTTTDAQPASTPKSDGAPATADPKPTATPDPSPSDPDSDEPDDGEGDSGSSPSEDDPSNGDGPQPTVPNDPSPTQQEPAQSEVENPSPAEGDAPASPQPSEDDQSPADPGDESPASPQPSGNDQSPENPTEDSPASDETPEDDQSPADPDDEPQDPDQATTQPNFTFDPEPTSADQPQDSTPEGDSNGSNGQDDSPAPSPTTTGGLGGIIASVFSMDPAPAPTPEPATTTTNALSVLQSAAESFGGGNGPAPTGDQAAPDDQLPSIVGGNAPQQTFEPITVSNDEQTHTLQPVEGSGGLFTIAPPAPSATNSDSDNGGESPDEPPNEGALTEPIILTDHDGDTQTVNPIADSPGLYSMVPAAPTPDSDSVPAAAFTGPATYVAGGETHTIRPVESTSGVFVVDGSRTVTRVAPSAGVGGGSGSGGQSTLGDGESGLPPVVTATGWEGAVPSASASASGGADGDGDGGGDVSSIDSPVAGSGAMGLRIRRSMSVRVGLVVVGYVMFI